MRDLASQKEAAIAAAVKEANNAIACLRAVEKRLHELVRGLEFVSIRDHTLACADCRAAFLEIASTTAELAKALPTVVRGAGGTVASTIALCRALDSVAHHAGASDAKQVVDGSSGAFQPGANRHPF